MAGYDVSGDDVITRDEFDASYGTVYPGCYDSVSLVAKKHTAKTGQKGRSLKEAISVGSKSDPDPDDVWAHFSGGDDEVTAQELQDGLGHFFPDLDAAQQQAMAECIMAGYDVSGDDVITRDEFDASYGTVYPGCYDSVSLVAKKHTAKKGHRRLRKSRSTQVKHIRS